MLQEIDWKIVAPILGFISAWAIYLLKRTSKRLSYGIVSSYLLLSKREEIVSQIEILFDYKSVENLYLLVLRIINDGNQSITKADFDKPLSFHFSEGVEILNSEIERKMPKNLDIEVTHSSTQVNFPPALMNSKDYFDIRLLLTNFDNVVFPDARIVGVKSVREYKREGVFDLPSFNSSLLFFLFIGFIVALSVIINVFQYETILPEQLARAFAAGFIFGISSGYLVADAKWIRIARNLKVIPQIPEKEDLWKQLLSFVKSKLQQEK